MWWIVWEVCVNCIECGLICYMMYQQLGESMYGASRICTGFVILLAVECALNLMDVPAAVVIVCAAVAFIVFAFACFGSTTFRRLLWGAIAFSALMMVNVAVTALLPALPEVDVAETLTPSPARLSTQIAYLLLLALICTVLSQLRSRRPQILGTGLKLSLTAMTLLGAYAGGQIVEYAVSSQHTDNERVTLAAVSAAVLAIVVSSLFLFDRLAAISARRLSAERETRMLEVEKTRIEEASHQYRIWNHDMRHTLDVVRYFAETGDMNGIIEYIGDISTQYSNAVDVSGTGIPEVDAVIALKRTAARNSGISFSMRTCSMLDAKCSNAVLSIILANLLDNAIDACEKLPDSYSRCIDMECRRKHDMIVVRITNSSDGVYNTDADGNLLSTKMDKNHGYGFCQLERLMAQDDVGFFEIFPEKDHFEVVVALNTQGDDR